MNWFKFSPAILTLLIFILTQGIGTLLLLLIGMEAASFALILMGVNILAVLCCHFFLHNICFSTACDVSLINWRPGMLAIIGGLLGAMSISILTENVELPEEMVQLMLGMSRNAWGLLILVIVGPITEELLFREAIEGEMLRRGANPWLAIIVSALAFSTVHFNLAQIFYAFPLGILFGIIYYRTESIVLTSLLHILNNGIVVAQLYLLGEDAVNASPADWFGSDGMAWTFMVLFGALSIIMIKLFWDRYHLCKKGT